MNEPTITVIGNLVADPELRYSNSGNPWVTMRIASTPRIKNRDGNIVDGEALFLGARAFGDYAVNISQSLTKGTRVIAQGNLTQRTYTDKLGAERTALDLTLTGIGPELRFHTAQAQPASKNNQNTGGAWSSHPAQNFTESPGTNEYSNTWGNGGGDHVMAF